MQTKTFSGNYFEIGKQLGKIYKKNRMNLNSVKVDEDLLDNQIKIYQKYFPGILEELKGINTILKLDEDKLFFHFLCADLNWFRKHYIAKSCTIFGIKNKNECFVGRNLDWLKSTEKFFQIYKMAVSKKNKYIGITDMLVLGKNPEKSYLIYAECETINDRGLFIGFDFALIQKWKSGLLPYHINRLVAENCKTVDEALNIFKKVPLCYPKFFFIADKSGKMVVVEHDSEKATVRNPINNVLIMTNHFVDKRLKDKDEILVKYPKNTTKLRYNEVDNKIKTSKKDFKFSDIIKILGAKNSHTCQNKFGIRTIWSLALDLKNKKYKIYWNLFGKRKEKTLNI